MTTAVQDFLINKNARWLMDMASDAMLIADSNGRILLANPASLRLFGYTAEEFAALGIEDLIPQRFRMAHDQKRAAYAQQPTSRSMGGGAELSGLRKDGSEFAADVSLSPIEDGRVLTTIYDISLRKRLETEQKSMIHELENVNEELKNFAYVISHDLKAPLRAIGSLADWIAADQHERLDAEGQEHLRLLIQRVRRLDALIDGVLRYSRIGRVHEPSAAVDFKQLTHDVVDSLAPPPHIQVQIGDQLPTLLVEKTGMQQVLQNLLANAVRYLDKPQGTILVDCSEQAECWQFSVADNGPGIAARHFERIFLLFQTLTPRDRVESTGVGLSIVKKIVEQSGGKVWVESVLGEGSTFFFTVPKQHPNQS